MRMGWVYSKNGYYIIRVAGFIQVACCCWESEVWKRRMGWVCSKDGHYIIRRCRIYTGGLLLLGE